MASDHSLTKQNCPGDSVLARLIAGDLSADEALILEHHLTLCENCRAHIDVLGEVPTIETLASAAIGTPELDSPSLRGVMERLLIESQLMNGSIHFSASPTREVFPTFQPTARSGFIGRLGDIDVRKVIGRGGMGIVFEGEDSLLNRKVAVKVLSPHLVGDGEAKSRFLREARAAASLTHENVVSIHSINEADGMPYLVLQFVAGESLSERLKRDKKLPFEDVLRIGIETARGLAASHKYGLIHRDIKPANILLDSETGAVRITDFGLAKHTDSDSITNLGTLAGTPAYMSPEQATGGELDGRSDLFSLGVLLYEASTGVSPFAAESPFVTLNNIRELEPPTVRSLNPELPSWFATIVERLLAKRPEKRVDSANLLVDLLERKTEIEPASIASRSRFSRVSVGLLAACLAGLAIGAVVFFPKTGAKKSNEDKSSVVGGPKPISGFVVDSQQETYSTLADAIEAAQDNSTITIHGDGPFSSESLTITGKGLVIRAGAGSLPRFTPAKSTTSEPDNSVSPKFITSDADLRIEGIEVNWPIDSPPIETNTPQLGFDETAERCAISSSGKLNLSHCRIIVGRFGTCLGVGEGEALISSCHFVSPSGYAIAWRPFVPKITIEQCLFEAKVAAVFRSSNNIANSTSVRFEFNTVIAERAFVILAINPRRKPTELHVSHNVFDCHTLSFVFLLGGFNPSQKSKMTDVLREVIVWQDASNVYRQGAWYLATNPFRQPLVAQPSDRNSLERWLNFWDQADSKSIEGKIKLNEKSEGSQTSVMAIEAPSGPLPDVYGAYPSGVGPGQAYHSRTVMQ